MAEQVPKPTHCFLVVLRPDDNGEEISPPPVEDVFAKSYAFVEGTAWVVGTTLRTCGDVVRELGIVDDRHDDWSVLVSKLNDYNGYAERELWEKITDWGVSE